MARPRPIHLDHGAANIQWDRTTDWVRRNLINRCEPVASGPGWREERTGLHEREFIETRRHWFTGTVPHDTKGGVNVLNLVEGERSRRGKSIWSFRSLSCALCRDVYRARRSRRVHHPSGR